MSDVSDVISAAREEIFITDWWLSPDIYLKRGMDFDAALRLDKLLKTKAVTMRCTFCPSLCTCFLSRSKA